MNESAGQGEQAATSRGASRSIVIGPGEGRTIQGTGAITLIATAEQTGGSIGVFEGTSPRGTGHPAISTMARTSCSTSLRESSYFWSGERQEGVSAGTYIFVPRGTVHAYKVIGTEQGRLLMAFIPGGPERLAEQFVKLSTEGEGVNRSMAQLNKMFAELNEKYDSEFVGPPL